MSPPIEDLIGRLRAIVGDSHVLTDPDATASFERDWTGRFGAPCALVVRPANTLEVSAVLRACLSADVPVIPQGGNTGLAGGGVPSSDEASRPAILSLCRLESIGPVDADARQVTCGAGVTLDRLNRAVANMSLTVGVDLAARDSATIGGMIATNAGGEKVLRYGMTRASVLGLEVVLADGRVLSRLNGLPKDNVGYDLSALFVGSEGTLGVITAARIRLMPLLTQRTVALVGIGGVEAAIELLSYVRSMLPSLECAELFFGEGLDLVIETSGIRRPFSERHPAYVLFEFADREDPAERVVSALSGAPGIRDSAIGTDGPARQLLWAYRERHSEAINRAGVPLKFDVAVPLAALAELVERAPQVIAGVTPHARLIVFGHLAEGNLHLNVLDAGSDHEPLTAAVLNLVAELGGSVSAEHGVGRAKAAWVELSRSPAEIAVMRSIKRALDPTALLNPGVLFEAPPA